MKKKILKKVKEVSRLLPAQFTNGKMFIKGQQIIDMRIRQAHLKREPVKPAKDIEGNDIEPDKQYSIDIDIRVNHTRRMKRLYNSGGMEAVKRYVREVLELNSEVQANHVKMMATMPTQPMSI